jgi:D-amino-acid oxidase
MQVTVIGCGVSGLTTAIILRRNGHDAHIVARDLPHDCVSMVAGAIWSPTTVEPMERTGPWALESRRVFSELADDPATGVASMVHIDLKRDHAEHWGESTEWVTRLGPDDVPTGYAGGLRVDGFRVEPPIYLDWLIGEFERSGGTVTLTTVADVSAVGGDAVVNCSGMGSRELVDDDTMYPIRGQMVLVENGGGGGAGGGGIREARITEGIADETDPTRISYIYPRSTHVYLGGQRAMDDDRPDPDPALTARILADAPRLDPRVAGRHAVAEQVGFRPGRPEVRLEAESMADGRTIVHNYGHGGAGYIMSWGCAAEVASLLD